jgi:hypothetical protein
MAGCAADRGNSTMSKPATRTWNQDKIEADIQHSYDGLHDASVRVAFMVGA